MQKPIKGFHFVVGRTKKVHVTNEIGRTLCRPNEATNYVDPSLIGMNDPYVIPRIALICTKCAADLRLRGIEINDYRARK